MHTLRLIFDTTFVGYFMALNLAYTVLLLLGSRQVSEWVRRRPLRDFRGVSDSPLSLPVTILAPAYNEEPVIVPPIRSLLASHSRRAAAPPLPRSEAALQDHLRRGPDLLDRGAGRARRAEAPARPLAAWPARDALAPPEDVRQPRYGGIGMIAVPFFLFFEALGPVVEISGLAYCVIGLMFGWVNPPFAAVLFGLAFTYGLVLSFGALLIEGRAFARYPGWRDLRRLMVAAVVENFGYRQWLAIVRTKALWTVLRPDTGWGEMTRVGFSEPVPAIAPGISSAADG